MINPTTKKIIGIIKKINDKRGNFEEFSYTFMIPSFTRSS